MTITPWTETAKSIAGILFGNPEMRSEAEKQDLERQKVEIQQKQYQLEEALNPAKIGQAEASAAYNRAQTQSENIATMLKQIELDNRKKFLEGGVTPPQGAPTMATMPEFNPYNVGPQGQGNNPAMILPYDQIKPLDIPTLDAALLDGGPTNPIAPPPELAPLGSFTPQMAAPAEPTAAGSFDELISSLTAPTMVQPPTGDYFSSDMTMPTTPAQPAQPVTLADMLSPEIRTMIAAGYLPAQNIGDFLLAQEGFNANQNVTDPLKRILNAAAGRGTFASPDQVTAQAMGSTLPTSELSDLGKDNMGTTDIKNFRLAQEDPAFADYLVTHNQSPTTTITYDANGKPIVTMGSGPKPLTEQQSKVAINASAMAPGVAVLSNAYNGGVSSSGGNLAVRAMFGDDPFITDMAQRANLINEDDQMINAAINGVMNFLYLQTGAARTESEDKRGYVELTPLISDTQETRNFKKAQLEQKARAIIRQGNPEIQDELLKAVEGIWTSQIPGSTNQITPAQGAPVEVTTQEQYDALPSGAIYLEGGIQFRKP